MGTLVVLAETEEPQTSYRWFARLAVALVIATATACGGDETPLEATSPGTSPSGVSTSAPVPSTAPRPTEPTVAPVTTAPAPPPTPAPAPEPEPEPVPAGRTVVLGRTFFVDVAESVGITGEQLTVTYSRLVADSRCPLDVQCITAGNAEIVVTIAKEGVPPASLSLNTTEGPASGQYLSYTVELVQLLRGSSPSARLRVA